MVVIKAPQPRQFPARGRLCVLCLMFFFFSSRRRHTRSDRDWSSDVCSSDLSNTFIFHFIHKSELFLVERSYTVVAFFGTWRRISGDSTVRLEGRVALVTGEIGRASCRERV